MSAGQSWHVSGFVRFRGTPQQLSEALASVGLRTRPGRYAVTVANPSDFVIRCIDDPRTGELYQVDADADSETEMVEAATRVSESLCRVSIEHNFEVVSPENESGKEIAYDG